MLVSHKHKLIFIHVHKTGGMSVENWLIPRCDDLHFDGHRHELASEAAARTPSWPSYFSFGFVRNPWARLVSWYFMIQENPTMYHHLPFWQYIRKSGPTFRDFIINCTETIDDDGTTKSATRPQIAYLCDRDSAPLVSFIGRFEHMEDDMRRVASIIGLPDGDMPRINASKVSKDYRSFYDNETRALVEERFARDIERFCYEF